MIGETRKERIDSIEAPYNRLVWFDDVEFESGMKLLRVTIREGRLMVEAANKYKRVVQVGSQQRSGVHYKEAVELIKSGGI